MTTPTHEELTRKRGYICLAWTRHADKPGYAALYREPTPGKRSWYGEGRTVEDAKEAARAAMEDG